MKEIGLDELKKIQMDVMASVHSFCIKYNLRYSLACGSLLGARRLWLVAGGSLGPPNGGPA